MSAADDLRGVIERCKEASAKPRSSIHFGAQYIGEGEVVVKLADLNALINEATWRVGYLEGKGDR